jgi:polyhydroxyalkanoate synthesis regulator phasin
MSERIKLLNDMSEQMNERTKLLKKAVLTSVGAGANVDRVKSALNEAVQDLLKVGQNLMDELEEKGKVKTDSVQDFLKNLQSEAYRKTSAVEKQVSSKVTVGVKKTIRELGLITQEDWEEMCDRLNGIEEALGIANSDANGSEEKPRSRRKKNH